MWGGSARFGGGVEDGDEQVGQPVSSQRDAPFGCGAHVAVGGFRDGLGCLGAGAGGDRAGVGDGCCEGIAFGGPAGEIRGGTGGFPQRGARIAGHDFTRARIDIGDLAGAIDAVVPQPVETDGLAGLGVLDELAAAAGVALRIGGLEQFGHVQRLVDIGADMHDPAQRAGALGRGGARIAGDRKVEAQGFDRLA